MEGGILHIYLWCILEYLEIRYKVFVPWVFIYIYRFLSLALFDSFFKIYVCMVECVFESIQIYIFVLNKFAI